jgi:hypothetical protein
MKKLVAVLFAAFALTIAACATTGPDSAPAENTIITHGPTPVATASMGDMTIALYDTPCTDATVIGFLKPEVVQYFQRATVFTAEHVNIEACYRNYTTDGAIFLMDSDGNYGGISMTQFTRHQPL